MRKPPRSFGWHEQLDFSNGHAPDTDSVFPFLRDRIPGFERVRRASDEQDKSGCDYYVERRQIAPLGIDLKLRRKDYSVAPHFLDDLALETWANIGTQKVGWTRDPSKTCDYVLWYWQNTGRFFIVPFPALCSVFQRRWRVWRLKYPVLVQESENVTRWQSECILVPRDVVTQAIVEWMSGVDDKRKTA